MALLLISFVTLEVFLNQSPHSCSHLSNEELNLFISEDVMRRKWDNVCKSPGLELAQEWHSVPSHSSFFFYQIQNSVVFRAAVSWWEGSFGGERSSRCRLSLLLLLSTHIALGMQICAGSTLFPAVEVANHFGIYRPANCLCFSFLQVANFTFQILRSFCSEYDCIWG